MTTRHRISAGAIVVHESRVLMVRHRKPETYDFWVCPGGGVQGTESLEAAAEREVKEETGLTVKVGQLAYIEEFFNPDTRFIKFWFLGAFESGTFDTSHPDTVGEYIIDAAWRTPDEVMTGWVFPEFVSQRFFQDMKAGLAGPVRMPLREMSVW